MSYNDKVYIRDKFIGRKNIFFSLLNDNGY